MENKNLEMKEKLSFWKIMFILISIILILAWIFFAICWWLFLFDPWGWPFMLFFIAGWILLIWLWIFIYNKTKK